MISKWESGEYNFTIEDLANICNKLNLDLEEYYSFDGKDKKQPHEMIEA